MTPEKPTPQPSKSFELGDFVEVIKEGISGYYTMTGTVGIRGDITTIALGDGKYTQVTLYVPTRKISTTLLVPTQSMHLHFKHVDPGPKNAFDISHLRARFPRGGFGMTLGSDPEVFVVNKKTGRVKSAYSLFPPKTETTTGVPFWDGFQAEFTVPPSTCLAYLTDYVQAGLAAIQKAIPPTHTITHKSVVGLTIRQLREAAPEEVQLGCAPSTNIYGEFVPYIGDPRHLRVRTSGCHMHFGQRANPQRVVRSMDRIAGVALTAILSDLQDARRRRFYGRAGEYRTPPHGIEWRVPGSEILVAPAMFHLAFDLARMAFALGVHTDLSLWDTTDDETQHAINEYDVRLCRKIIHRNASVFRELCKCMYNGNNGGSYDRQILDNIDTRIMNLVDQGISQYIDLDMPSNWRLGKGTWRMHSEASGAMFSRFAAALA